MLLAHLSGWGVPILGVALALVLSGVSFRLGSTCHVNHDNSLADLWLPLLIFATTTVVLTFTTVGYCVKVYLCTTYEVSAATAESGLASLTGSSRYLSPRQAYQRVSSILKMQWREIVMVLIIITDVIFFSIVFISQDAVEESVKNNPKLTQNWIMCLISESGNKKKCLELAKAFVVSEATIAAVLLLLSVSLCNMIDAAELTI